MCVACVKVGSKTGSNFEPSVSLKNDVLSISSFQGVLYSPRLDLSNRRRAKEWPGSRAPFSKWLTVLPQGSPHPPTGVCREIFSHRYVPLSEEITPLWFFLAWCSFLLRFLNLSGFLVKERDFFSFYFSEGPATTLIFPGDSISWF